MPIHPAALLAVPFSLITIMAPAAARAGGAPEDVRIVVLHTNDIHGQMLPRMLKGRGGDEAMPVGGAAALDSFLKREREAAKLAGAHTLLVDSGDWYQGTPEGNFAKDHIPGALAVDWMNRAGYDAAVIGNHEFDFGYANLTALLARAKFTPLGANILAPVAAGAAPARDGAGADGKPSLAPIAKPYVVLERGGVKVAFVGILTADTPRMVAKGRLGDVVIPDELEQSRLWYDRARKEADVVVLLTHCGKDVDKKIAERVPEAPLILGGHNHERIKQPFFVEHEAAALKANAWKGEQPARTYILQSGCKTEAVDRFEFWIDPADKKIRRVEPRVFSLDVKDVGEDAATKKWLADETGPVTAAMDRAIAEIAPPAENAPKGQRTDPTTNFMTDAMLWAAKQADPTVVATFGNGGGVRTKIESGALTVRKCYEIVPFDNTIVIFSMKGSELLDALGEASSGERPARALSAGLVGSLRRAASGAWDASALQIGGAPFDPAATYRVSANSFIAEGKGGFPKFADGMKRIDLGVLVRDAMIDFATEKKKLVMDDELRLRYDGGRNGAPQGGDKSGRPASSPARAGAGAR